MPDSRDLSVSECETLLRAGVAGRVALVTPTGPYIVPVNYSVVDGNVVIRTSPYSLLGTYGRDTTLAFEVDHLDYPRQRGWSVVVRGRAEAIHDTEEIERIRRTREPRPWASGSRTLFLRLHCIELTGRQLGTGWDAVRELPVHRAV
jgi:nitroimidazol reductase NimA-like FMN-containing flavoprotein (pyridoxamine 5'-phosphate oxidase superfamily)